MSLTSLTKEIKAKEAELRAKRQEIEEQEERILLDRIHSFPERKKLIATIIHGYGMKRGDTLDDVLARLAKFRGDYLVCDYFCNWSVFTKSQCVRYAKDVLAGRDAVEDVTIFDLGRGGQKINLNYIVNVIAK
jgi:hypothetical protein